jgi:hypothetical protein
MNIGTKMGAIRAHFARRAEEQVRTAVMPIRPEEQGNRRQLQGLQQAGEFAPRGSARVRPLEARDELRHEEHQRDVRPSADMLRPMPRITSASLRSVRAPKP